MRFGNLKSDYMYLRFMIETDKTRIALAHLMFFFLIFLKNSFLVLKAGIILATFLD